MIAKNTDGVKAVQDNIEVVPALRVARSRIESCTAPRRANAAELFCFSAPNQCGSFTNMSKRLNAGRS